MERVSFLIERTGSQIPCLLNPESLLQQRIAGVRARRGATGIITGRGLSDDPLVATGGGVTELDLDLLFDVDIAREGATAASSLARPSAGPPQNSAITKFDVRDLTRPIWNLAENSADVDGSGALPAIRFIWGRSWNVLAVVIALAERLERFTASGVPQRSWLRLRLRRLTESDVATARTALPRPLSPVEDSVSPEAIEDGPRVAIPVEPDGMPSLRLDQIANDRYGDPSLWRWVAKVNNIDNPLALAEATVLHLGAHRAEIVR